MARFYPLEVTDIRRETRDSVVVTLAPPVEERDAFHFIQGQYLTFRRKFDGEELRRSYSICAGRGEGLLRVGIKKVDGGCFSSWANEALEVGDTLEAMAPMGNFHAPLEPEAARPHWMLMMAAMQLNQWQEADVQATWLIERAYEDEYRLDAFLVRSGAVDLGGDLPEAILQTALPRLQPMLERGLADLDGETLSVTPTGQPFARMVASAFDAYLNETPGRHSLAV